MTIAPRSHPSSGKEKSMRIPTGPAGNGPGTGAGGSTGPKPPTNPSGPGR